MNAKQGKRSARHKAKYTRQFLKTNANKFRRVARRARRLNKKTARKGK